MENGPLILWLPLRSWVKMTSACAFAVHLNRTWRRFSAWTFRGIWCVGQSSSALHWCSTWLLWWRSGLPAAEAPLTIFDEWLGNGAIRGRKSLKIPSLDLWIHSSEQQCHTEPADIRCLQLSFHLYCNHVKASLGASVKQFSLKFNVLNAVWHFAALGCSTLQCAHDEPTDTFWRSSHYSIAFGMRRGSFVQVANWNDPYTHDSQDHTSNLQKFLLMYPNVLYKSKGLSLKILIDHSIQYTVMLRCVASCYCRLGGVPSRAALTTHSFFPGHKRRQSGKLPVLTM